MRPVASASRVFWLAALLIIPTRSTAGVVFLLVDPGAPAAVVATYANGTKIPLLNPGFDFSPIDEIFIPNEGQVVGATFVKILNGVRAGGILNLTPPVTLASLEPFTIPSFVGPINKTPLVASFAMPGFLSGPESFAVGDLFTATDGLIAGVGSLTILDGSSLPADVLAAANDLDDPSFVASLPAFTGTVEVSALDTFSVPEPCSLTLGGAAIPVLLGYSRLRRPRRPKSARTAFTSPGQEPGHGAFP